MRYRILAPVVLFLLAVGTLPAGAQEWSGRGRLNGTVLDENGNGLADSKITLYLPGQPEAGPEPFMTNKKGRWSFLGLRHGLWTVVIEVPGYKISEGTVKVNEFGSSDSVTIEMVPNPYSSIDVGDRYLGEGDYANARAEYEKALEHLEPQNRAQLRSRIADTYISEGNIEAARAEYKRALPDLAPGEQVHVRLRLADTYFQEGAYDQARNQYSEVANQLEGPEKAQIQLKIAQSYGLEQNNLAAIAALEAALELSPGEPAILQLIADLLSREGRDEEAEAYLAQMPEGVDVPIDLVMNIGIRDYNNGDLEGALERFNQAVEAHPEMPEVYYYRGLVHLNQGDNDAARADFDKLLEIAPDHAKAAEVQEFLKYIQGG